ncbi:repressor [Lactococcus lactis subsp. lactis]|nr:repressor [Lactococcus lactis subsp. lactis]
MSREDWRTGSIPELPLLRKQNNFNERRKYGSESNKNS